MIDKTNYFYHATDKLIKIYDELIQYMLDDIVERVLKNEVITDTAEYRIWKLQELGLHLEKIREYIKKSNEVFR